MATPRRGGKVLELALLRRSVHPAWKGSFPLTRGGTLALGAASELASELATVLGPREPSAREAESGAEARAARPAAPAPPPPAGSAPG